MTRKSIILIVIVVVIAVAGIIWWWSGANTSPSPDASKTPATLYTGKITIGTETWPGYIALYVARDKGYFRDAGLDVDIKRYIALGELSKDYVAGKMQGRANLTLDAVNEAYQGLDHKVILAIDYSAGSDAIIAREGIQSVADFKGKRVGYEPGTLEEFFITWALGEFDLTLGDVTPVYGNPEETTKLLEAGEVDVAVSHEPFLSQLTTSEGFHVVYSSKNAPGLITDILTFRSDFIEQYPDTVRAIVAAYFRAIDVLNDSPVDAHTILAQEFGDTPEGIAKQLEGVTMLGKSDNITAFTFAAGLQSLYGNMRRIGQFVYDARGAKDQTLDTDILIDKTFVRDQAQ